MVQDQSRTVSVGNHATLTCPVRGNPPPRVQWYKRGGTLPRSDTQLYQVAALLGPDSRNILRQSDDYLTIMPKLRSTYDGRLIYKTSYNEWKAFLG